MKRSRLGRIWPNATAIVLFIGFVFPVYWMFNMALKPTGDILSEDPVWFPSSLTFEHFETAINAPNFWTLVRNSLTVTLLVALGASFAIARMRFKGRRRVILVFMIAQMAPWEVMVIAIYMLVRDADMLNSLVPLTLFYTAMVLPLTILTLRNYIAAVPKETGGVRHGRRLLPRPGLPQGDLPAARPRDDGHLPLRLHHRLERVPDGADPQQGGPGPDAARVALQLPEQLRQRDWGATMAAASLFALPILILFLFLQRRAVGGLTSGAVKG